MKRFLSNIFFWKKLSPMQRRYWHLALGAFLVVAVPLAIATLVNPGGKASAAWFNDNWGYRKAVTLTVTSSASDITNLQTLLTVDTTGITANLQTNCEDFRFTSVSGKILPYYAPSCSDNSATNKVWVQADLVPKNTTTYTLYMYYGNPTAGATSSSAYFDNVVGLVGYWTLNESSWTGDCSTSTVNDSSVKGTTGKACPNASAPSPTSGKYGNAGSFDGSNDYIELDNPSALQITGNLTIEAWVKLTDNTSAHTIFSKMSSGAGQYSYRLYVRGDAKLGMEVSSDGTVVTSVAGNTTLSTGTWYHLVGVYNPSNSLTVYVNGTQDNTNTSSIPASIFNGSATVEIGGQSTVNVMSGLIDNTLVYNTIRTAGQIAVDYSTTYSIQTTNPSTITPSTSFASEEKAPSPIAYWKFDDGTGTNANDATTNNNDGTISGATWQTEDQCISGKCLYFDGTDDYVNVTDSASTSITGNMTVSFWTKPKNLSGTYILLAKMGTTTQNAYYVDTVSSGKLRFWLSGTGSSSVDNYLDTDNVVLTANTWSYVSIVYNASAQTVTFYVNGNSVPATLQGGSIPSSIFDSNQATTIGAYRNSDSTVTAFYPGFIDEPKVYNYARSAAEIKADLNSRSNPEGLSSQVSQLPNNQPGALSNGLIGYWKMDEASGNAADSSGNASTLTNNATTTYTAGKFGNAPNFNGTTQYFSVADNTTLSTGDIDFTVSAWVNMDTKHDTYSRPILAKWGVNGGGNEREYILQHNTANDRFEFGVSSDGADSGATYATANTLGSPSTGTWYFVVGWHDSVNNVVGISVNGGAADTSAHTTGARDGAGAFEIGRNDKGTLYFDGKIDEARVYKRVLSAAERTQLYNFAPGPVGYWKMDENTGTSAFDSSGNAYTGTLTSGPTWKPGKFGAATNYDGTDDRIVVTDNSTLDIGVSDFTLEAWIKMDTTSNTNETIFDKRATGDPYTGYVLYFQPGALAAGCAADNSFRAQVNAGTLTDKCFAAGSDIRDNKWHHITFSVSRSSSTGGKVYLDGVLLGSQDFSSQTATIANSADLVIGRSGQFTDDPFKGLLDDIKIYNYARTADQIVSDMNAGHPTVGTPVAAAVAHWKMDEGYGTTANDSTPNDNDLTLNSASWTNSGKFVKAWNGVATGRMSRATDADLEFAATESFTISGWFKTDSATNPARNIEYLVSTTTGNTDVGYSIYANTDGTICFGIDDDATWGPDVASCTTTDYYDGTWHYFTAVRDVTADKTYLYIDAISRDSDTDSTTGTLDGDNTFFIGDFDTDDDDQTGIEEFAGDIDEVKVYRFALTADQVKLDMNRGSAQVLGALSDNSTYQPQAANQEYCIPGDSTSCTAPVGRWDFEEGTGSSTYDTSGGGSTGTITGATYAVGKVGKALNFNGSTDAVTVSNSLSTKTVSFWVNPSTTTQNLIDLRTAATAANISVSSGTISATGFTSPTIYVNGAVSSTLAANSWQYVTITTGTAITANAISFGRISSTSLTGKLDSIRFFDYARSAAQVAWDYNRGAPVGHWKFDECQGDKVNDSSGNSNTGTITSTQGLGTCTGSAGTMWKDGATGKYNYSLDFDGTGDYVSVADPSSGILDPGTNDFSISAWVKFPLSGSSVWDGIITKGFTTSAPASTWGLVTGNPVTDIVYQDATNAGGAWNVTVSFDGTTLSSGFHLVTLTRSGTAYVMYIDGISRATGTGLATVNLANGSALQFANADSRYFGNQIDDVKFFNYALTATQVKELYGGGAIRFGPATGAP